MQYGTKDYPFTEFNVSGVFAKAKPSMESFYVLVSPALARDWLQHRNSDNRSLRRKRAKIYGKAVLDGTFRTTGQAILFDVNGVLQDGQHRLEAIVTAGTPALLYITFYCDPKDRDVLDQGLPRSVNDDLERKGYQNRTVLQSSARLLRQWETGAWHNQGDLKDVVVTFVDDRPRLAKVAPIAAEVYRKTSINKAALAAFMYLAGETGEYEVELQSFIDKLVSGEGLTQEDPVMRVIQKSRELMKRSNIKPRHWFEVLIFCWNKYIDGRKMPKHVNYSTRFPREIHGAVTHFRCKAED